ncbi:hypothetical protein HQ520_02835, partial [bacterium]|nr:hypothetical protein [bacterium]
LEFSATEDILKELDCTDTTRLIVWNKIDQIDDPIRIRELLHLKDHSVAISALEGTGLEDLLAETERLILEQGIHAVILVPYDHYDLVARLHRESNVLETRDLPAGKLLRCRLPEHLQEVIAPYRLEEWPDETKA